MGNPGCENKHGEFAVVYRDLIHVLDEQAQSTRQNAGLHRGRSGGMAVQGWTYLSTYIFPRQRLRSLGIHYHE